MAKQKKTFAVGDIVRYTGDFLRSTGMLVGAPINGIVREIKGEFSREQLISVEWCDDLDNPSPVLACNVELDRRAMRSRG